MSTYIHFTDAQKEQARQTELVSLLRSQGETLKRSGKEYEWRDGSQKVTVRGNLWYHQYEEVGGDAITLSEGTITSPMRRQWNICSADAAERLRYRRPL